jgi:flagellar FliL protein
MSTAAAETPEVVEDAAPKRGFGKKKLLVLLVVALLVVAIAGGGVLWFLKKRAARLAAEAENGDAVAEAPAEHKRDAKHAPTFVPLDPFTVNLADREAERYAQIGVTLELEDAHAADDIKAYMPAIRSGILMVLAQKTSQDLLDAEGKKKLAFEIKREASRALGIEIEDEMAPKAPKPASGAKPAKRKVYEPSPISKVHFSNFIIQ